MFLKYQFQENTELLSKLDMTNVTASWLIASSKSLSVAAMMFFSHEVVLCAMAMWFSSEDGRKWL